MPEEYDINRKISFINSYESESYSFQLCKYSLKLQKVKTRDSRKNPRKFQRVLKESPVFQKSSIASRSSEQELVIEQFKTIRQLYCESCYL